MGNPTFERKRGVIKVVFRAKQYGFIQVTPKEEYFFHSTALQGMKFADLTAGDTVSFIPTAGREGKLRAVGVRRIDADAGAGDSSVPADLPQAGEGVVPEQATGSVRQQEDDE